MIQYYLSNPKYILLMAVLIAVTLFVCFKAISASIKHGKKNNEIIAKLKEENALRNEFAILTNETVQNADPVRLFKGVSLNLQKRVADKEDMFAEFDSLEEWQKYIYALSIFFEDAENGVGNFFRMNTKPLTNTALRAVDVIIGGRLSEIFTEEYNQFDEDNEEISLDDKLIASLDKEAAPLLSNGTAMKTAGEYIKTHFS